MQCLHLVTTFVIAVAIHAHFMVCSLSARCYRQGQTFKSEGSHSKTLTMQIRHLGLLSRRLSCSACSLTLAFNKLTDADKSGYGLQRQKGTVSTTQYPTLVQQQSLLSAFSPPWEKSLENRLTHLHRCCYHRDCHHHLHQRVDRPHSCRSLHLQHNHAVMAWRKCNQNSHKLIICLLYKWHSCSFLWCCKALHPRAPTIQGRDFCLILWPHPSWPGRWNGSRACVASETQVQQFSHSWWRHLCWLEQSHAIKINTILLDCLPKHGLPNGLPLLLLSRFLWCTRNDICLCVSETSS